MKLKGRKLYPHGQNSGIFLLQLPKAFTDDMEFSKDTTVTVEYEGGKLIITKDEEEQCQEES
jgi:hypothetical protein